VISQLDDVRFLSRSAAEAVQLQPQRASEAWFVYQRLAGRRRGMYLGPFEGPAAAIAHLRDVVELELLLLEGQSHSTSMFRITRRTSRPIPQLTP
jgi:hypothetical protein